MSKPHVHHHNATAEGAAIGVVVVIALFAVVLVAPGALLVFAVDRLLGLSLDVAQLWTFAAVASAGMIGGFAGVARGFTQGPTRFFLVALGVGAFLVIAKFGFHASWPDQLVAAFTNHRAGYRNRHCVARGQAMVWQGHGAKLGKVSRSHALARGTAFASATAEAEMDERILGKLINDPHTRRELLWLRAREKGNDGDARDIERVDPGVVSRLRAAGFDVDVRPDDELRGRCERFGRMMDERQEQHMDRLAR